MAVRQASIKRKILCTVRVADTETDGSFQCPKCGVKISPDDETDETYQILDAKVMGNQLVELTIKCSCCSSLIRLIGFPPEAPL